MKGLRRGEKGFTLIELLIVVAILGILAAVIIPNLATFVGTGEVNAANTELENVKTASLAYYADNSDWPDTSGDLGDYISGTVKATYTFDASGFVTLGVPTATGWSTKIKWQAGGANEHGKWVRA
jgi:type IV pilus assembly protein PilA